MPIGEPRAADRLGTRIQPAVAERVGERCEVCHVSRGHGGTVQLITLTFGQWPGEDDDGIGRQRSQRGEACPEPDADAFLGTVGAGRVEPYDVDIGFAGYVEREAVIVCPDGPFERKAVPGGVRGCCGAYRLEAMVTVHSNTNRTKFPFRHACGKVRPIGRAEQNRLPFGAAEGNAR